MNYEGLKDDVLAMMAGDKVRVNVNTFQNDLTTVASKDDALTALIHLGYLGYDADKKSAYVPNYEVAAAFELALQTGAWSEVAKSISKWKRVCRSGFYSKGKCGNETSDDCGIKVQ